MAFCEPEAVSIAWWAGHLALSHSGPETSSFWSPIACWFVLLWIIDRVMDSPYCICVTYQRLCALGRWTRKHSSADWDSQSRAGVLLQPAHGNTLQAWLMATSFIFLFASSQNVTERLAAGQVRQHSFSRVLWLLHQETAISLNGQEQLNSCHG